MKRKIVNILMILIMCITMNLFRYETCAANEINTLPITNPDYYQPGSTDTVSGANKIKNIGNTIIGALQVIGTITSVVVLVVLGIKYMVGSAEERAEYKKSMTPYIIGAVMVFAITNLLGIVAEVAKSLW